MAGDDVYEVFAIRYGYRDRKRSDVRLLDPDPNATWGMAYFFWVIRNAARTIVVDCGFDAESAARLGRPPFDDPATLLRDFGVDPATVETLILSHLHFDHIGALPAFPKARFQVQAADIAFATGPLMRYHYLRYPYEKVQVAQVVEAVHDGRVDFHDGDGVVAPGITVHRIDGHAIGLQAVRVKTARGHVVLASDAAPYAEHFIDYSIAPVLVDAAEMCKGYDRLKDLADSEDHIITGHDPLVSELYPQVGEAPMFAVHAAPSETIRDAVARVRGGA